VSEQRKIVIVSWADAHGSDKAVTVDDIEHEPYMTDSLGWLIKEDEVGVTISMDSYPNHPEDVHTVAFIPRGMVRCITYLSDE